MRHSMGQIICLVYFLVQFKEGQLTLSHKKNGLQFYNQLNERQIPEAILSELSWRKSRSRNRQGHVLRTQMSRDEGGNSSPSARGQWINKLVLLYEESLSFQSVLSIKKKYKLGGSNCNCQINTHHTVQFE